MNRRRTINVSVLRILEALSPNAMPEGQLGLELDGAVRPKVEPEDFASALAELCRAGYIVEVELAMDRALGAERRWAVTETGVAALRALGIPKGGID